MDSRLEEIHDELISGNFQTAEQISRNWLSSFKLHEKNEPIYHSAVEGYTYAKFFLHRQDRLSHLQDDAAKARGYIDLFKEIGELRHENGFERKNNLLWEAVDLFIHARIAEGFARAFAGEKSYNLNDSEIVQLGISLLKVGKWKAAEEALSFLLRLNKNNPRVNYLISYAYYKLGNSQSLQLSLREALFHNPQVVSEYPEFLPGPEFARLWESLERSDNAARCREFALVLELNGVYRTKRVPGSAELEKLEKQFNDLFRLYKKNPEASIVLAEALQILCWMIYGYQKSGEYEKVEYYRSAMIALSPDSWALFQEKNLQN